MFNFDYLKKENIKERNTNWPEISYIHTEY